MSRPEAFRALLKEFIETPALVYLAGVLGMLGGLALVLTHNVWSLDWRLLITLIGWFSVVRAVVTIFQPDRIVSLGSKAIENRGFFFAAAVIDLATGLILTYFGYFA